MKTLQLYTHGNFLKDEKQEKNNARNKGVTIIALIITIVILFIIAGVTTSILTNGTFNKAKNTVAMGQSTLDKQKGQEEYVQEDVTKYPGKPIKSATSLRDNHPPTGTISASNVTDISATVTIVGNDKDNDMLMYTLRIKKDGATTTTLCGSENQPSGAYDLTDLEAGTKYICYGTISDGEASKEVTCQFTTIAPGPCTATLCSNGVESYTSTHHYTYWFSTTVGADEELFNRYFRTDTSWYSGGSFKTRTRTEHPGDGSWLGGTTPSPNGCCEFPSSSTKDYYYCSNCIDRPPVRDTDGTIVDMIDLGINCMPRGVVCVIECSGCGWINYGQPCIIVKNDAVNHAPLVGLYTADGDAQMVALIDYAGRHAGQSSPKVTNAINAQNKLIRSSLNNYNITGGKVADHDDISGTRNVLCTTHNKTGKHYYCTTHNWVGTTSTHTP